MQKELRCRNIRIANYLLSCKATLKRIEEDNGAVYVFVENDRCMAALRDFKEQSKIAYY